MMTDPTRHLVEPVPLDDTVTSGFVNPGSILDYVSPSSWINDVIEDLTGYDVTGSLIKPFAGDWAAVSAYGDALKKMSRCLAETAAQVQSATFDLDRRWDGNAADSAYVYFASTATSLSAHAQLLDEAGKQYQGLARCVWQFAEQAKSFVQALADQALLAAVYAAAGTVTAETGVGALIGYGLAAMEITKMLQTINTASRIIQTAITAMYLVLATLFALTRRLADLGGISIQGAPYTHPMVR